MPHATGNRFVEPYATVQDLILEAYSLHDFQLSGLPEWTRSPGGQHFSVEATTAGSETPSADRLKATLQSLLADRFGLRAHREMAELPVYVLMIAKRGARMRELNPEEQIPKYPANASETARGTIQDVLSMVRIFADRLVVDEIGLTGRYEYPNPRPREIAAQLGEGPRAPVSLLMASLQRMGLKLQPGKRKVETLVIDRVDRPLAN